MEYSARTSPPAEKQSPELVRTSTGGPSNSNNVDPDLPPYTDEAAFEDTAAAASPPVPAQIVAPPAVDIRPQPVRLSLINPHNISSGFTLAIPDALRVLPSRQFDAERWTRFVRELNAVLSKAPGTIAKEVTEFWLVHLCTLGTAGMSTKIYAKRIRQKAQNMVENWNRVDLAQMGLHARLSESTVEANAHHTDDLYYRRYGRQSQSPDNALTYTSLELAVERL